MKRYTTHTIGKREKQNKRIKQLKRNLAKTQAELKNIDACRVIARRQLGSLRDFLLTVSRLLPDENRKQHWLKHVGDINLILSITTSNEEFDREWAGEKVQPYELTLSDEERALLHKEFADDNN